MVFFSADEMDSDENEEKDKIKEEKKDPLTEVRPEKDKDKSDTESKKDNAKGKMGDVRMEEKMEEDQDVTVKKESDNEEEPKMNGEVSTEDEADLVDVSWVFFSLSFSIWFTSKQGSLEPTTPRSRVKHCITEKYLRKMKQI